jgi:hypothetical protein
MPCLHKGKNQQKNGINYNAHKKKNIIDAPRLIWGQGIQI